MFVFFSLESSKLKNTSFCFTGKNTIFTCGFESFETWEHSWSPEAFAYVYYIGMY